DAAHDADVAVLVVGRAVAREVVLAVEILGPVGLLVALGVAPDRAEHGRPGALDDETPALALADRVTCLVHDVGYDARQRKGRGTGLGRGRARQRRDHVSPGLGLPPGIHDRTAPAADGLVVPHPRLGIDRLADGAEN